MSGFMVKKGFQNFKIQWKETFTVVGLKEKSLNDKGNFP